MVELKTLKDIETFEHLESEIKEVGKDTDGKYIPLDCSWWYKKIIRIDDLCQVAREWIKEIDEITDNYVENGGEMSDDEVMEIFKERHHEWHP